MKTLRLCVIILLANTTFLNAQKSITSDFLLKGNLVVRNLPTQSGEELFVTNAGFLEGSNFDKVFAKKIFGNTLWNDNRRLESYEFSIRIAAQMPVLMDKYFGIEQTQELFEQMGLSSEVLEDVSKGLDALNTNYIEGKSIAARLSNKFSRALRQINPKMIHGKYLPMTNLKALGKFLEKFGYGIQLGDFAVGAGVQQALAGDIALMRLDILQGIISTRNSNIDIDPVIFDAIERARKNLSRSEDYWGALLTELTDRKDEAIQTGVNLLVSKVLSKGVVSLLKTYYMNYLSYNFAEASTQASTVGAFWVGSLLLTYETIVALLKQHKKAQVSVTSATLAYILLDEIEQKRINETEIVTALRLQSEYSYYYQMVEVVSGFLPDFFDLITNVFYYYRPYDEAKEEFTSLKDNIIKEIIDFGPIEFESLESLSNKDRILNIVIFDNSGSMRDRSKSTNLMKIKEAKIAFNDIISNASDKFDWTLLTYSPGCSVEELISNSSDIQKLKNIVNWLSPGGSTPIGYSLQKALDIYEQNPDYQKIAIIILTDGEETCDEGLPEKVANEIRNYIQLDEEIISFEGILYTTAYAADKLPPLEFYMVGFTTDSTQNTSLERLTNIAGGKFFTSANLPELKNNLKEIVESIGGKNNFVTTVLLMLLLFGFMGVVIGFILYKKSSGSSFDRERNITSPKIVLTNLKTKKRFVIQKTPVTIGRASDNDIVLNSKYVSKHHALINFNASEKKYYIKKLSNVNKIIVNGKSVQLKPLNDGDKLKIVDFTFIINSK